MAEQLTRINSANAMIAGLSPDDLTLIRSLSTPVAFPPRHILEHRNRTISAIYFLQSGLVSVVAVAAVTSAELALVGREGMTGLNAVLGADRSSFDYHALTPVTAHCIAIDDFREVMRKSAPFTRSVLRFANLTLEQIGQALLTNAQGRVHERIARWLVLAHERLDGDEIRISHEVIAQLLGVRRAGVTEALGRFDTLGLISMARGCITIADRARLIEVSNGHSDAPQGARPEFDQITKNP